MKKSKIILKFDLAEYDLEELLEHLERNYNFKILDKEDYEEE